MNLQHFILRVKIKVDYIRRSFLSHIAPVHMSKVLYRRAFGKDLNLDNPNLLNEKLMWLKLYKYTDNELVTRCIDKYEVRNYVKACHLEGILNELINSWDSVDEINWDELPQRFVLKCNHGCAFNIICTDKQTLNISEAKKRLKKWMKSESWVLYAETNYKNIKHKVICEKYLDGLGDALPVDYKIYCFQGEPKYIGNFIERDIENGTLTRGFFNTDWTPSDVFVDRDKMDLTKFPKPKDLELMLDYARILSKPFPFVRVDLYNVHGRIVFGELTFTPTGCLGTYYTEEANLKLGDILDVNYSCEF